MTIRPSIADDRRRPQDRLRLVLATADGDVWSLTMSRGIERFIGRYARVAGVRAAGPLLRFVPVAPGAGEAGPGTAGDGSPRRGSVA